MANPLKQNINTQEKQQVNQDSSRNINVINKDTNSLHPRKISLDDLQELLTKKQLVKELLKNNNQFLEIVTGEIKAKIQNDLRSNLFNFKRRNRG